MFQMSKQLFNQCWPVIAAQIETEKSAPQGGDDSVPAPSLSTAAEAGYVLGVAIGFELQVDVATGARVSIAVPGWHTDASGDMNWPNVMAPTMSQGLYNQLA